VNARWATTRQSCTHNTRLALRFAPYRAQPDRITLSLALQCETYRNRTGTQCAARRIESIRVATAVKFRVTSGKKGTRLRFRVIDLRHTSSPFVLDERVNAIRISALYPCFFSVQYQGRSFKQCEGNTMIRGYLEETAYPILSSVSRFPTQAVKVI